MRLAKALDRGPTESEWLVEVDVHREKASRLFVVPTLQQSLDGGPGRQVAGHCTTRRTGAASAITRERSASITCGVIGA